MRARSPNIRCRRTWSPCPRVRSAGERLYSGEGLVGFAWAFLRAGARRVVAGLWDVDDKSTVAVMDRLYAGVSSGEPPVTALRDAKLALVRAGGVYAKPGPLGAVPVVHGDGRSNRSGGRSGRVNQHRMHVARAVHASSQRHFDICRPARTGDEHQIAATVSDCGFGSQEIGQRRVHA